MNNLENFLLPCPPLANVKIDPKRPGCHVSSTVVMETTPTSSSPQRAPQTVHRVAEVPCHARDALAPTTGANVVTGAGAQSSKPHSTSNGPELLLQPTQTAHTAFPLDPTHPLAIRHTRTENPTASLQPRALPYTKNENTLLEMSWKIQDLPEKGTAAASHRNATKRLLKEMDVWRSEQVDERGVERLGPVGDEDLLSWEAVINGRGVGAGYESMFAICSLPPTHVTHVRLADRRTQEDAGSSASRSRRHTPCTRQRSGS